MKNLSFFLYIFLLVNIISKPKTRRTSVTHHKKNNPPPNNDPPKEQPKKEEPQKNEQLKKEQQKVEEENKQKQNQNQQSIKNDLNKKNDTDNKKIIPEKKEFNLTEEVEKDAIKKQNDVQYQAKVTRKQYKKKSKKEQYRKVRKIVAAQKHAEQEKRRREEEEKKRKEEEEKKKKEEELKKKKEEEEKKKKIEEEKKRKEEEEKRKKEEEEKNKKKTLQEEKSKFETQFSKFHSKEIMTINLKGGEYELFYEEINEKSKIKLAFIVNQPDQLINFFFAGPESKNPKVKPRVILSILNSNFYYNELELNEPGLYTFNIDNRKNKQENIISFALSYNDKNNNALEWKSMDNLSKKLNNIKEKMNELTVKQSLVVKRSESHNESVKKHNKSITLFAIIEMITIAFIFIFQIFYFKKLINKV
jgi:hypothetical protein